ncbi:MAG: hypothetical protein KME07_25225 [Pegethrix bostrychoides GSE-TBD4-15B]|jgi:Spy/CpxP family protein refolding chaperone|uniref:Uncharacterized protein n=1 Tax=Pegethrix bostrychoides GSE-TBD4-15B TaxID=2839662 RepID=A0A951PFL6_9CYAN|nr:hypothetical protein [Pegethrix bostrychoides GSE-TBD4-15B]
MKFNPLLIVTGGCISGILAIAPLVSSAQIAQANAAGSSAQAIQISQAGQEASDHRGMRQAFEQLDLTPEQQTQLVNLRRDSRSQIQAILQPEQRQQFITAWQQGGGFRDAVAAMNLTDTQQQQIQEVFQSSRTQARALLSESQRQELRQILQEHLDKAF